MTTPPLQPRVPLPAKDADPDGERPAAPKPIESGSSQSGPPESGPPESRPPEFGGPSGPEPTRYGDWERNGRVSDF